MAPRTRPTPDSNAADAAVLAERVTRLEDDFKGLNKKIDQLDQGLGNVNIRIGAVDAALQVLRTDMNAHQASNIERTKDIKEDIRVLSKTLEGNSILLQALVAQLSTTTADMAATPAGRAGLQQIEDVKTRVKTLEDRMLTSDRESSQSRGEKNLVLAAIKFIGPTGMIVLLFAILWIAQAVLHLSLTVGPVTP